MVDIQQHPWFISIDWQALEAKEAQPPFVPDVGRSDFMDTKSEFVLHTDEESQFRCNP
jgi:hypothetical protein